MVGGKIEDLEEIKQYLNCYCRDIQYMGENGSGQHTKMAN